MSATREPPATATSSRLDEILRLDAATRTVPEHEDASGVVDVGDVGVRRAERGSEHESRHAP